MKRYLPLLLLCACAGVNTQPIRTALNDWAISMKRLKPALVVMCAPQDPPPPKECAEALAGFNALDAENKHAQDALDVVEGVTP